MRTIRLMKNISRFSICAMGTASLACATFSDVQAQEIRALSDAQPNSAETISKVITKDKLVSKKQKASELSTVSQPQSVQLADQGALPQDTGGEKREAEKKEVEKPNRFSIGINIFNRDYREEVAPGLKSNEAGTLLGGQLDYDYLRGDSIYFGSSLRYSDGITSFDGTTQTGIPLRSITQNRFLNIDARLGYTFKIGQENSFLLTPFVGIGYNRWFRDLRGPGGFFEDYSWTAIETGFRSEFKLSPKFDLGLNLKLAFPQDGNLEFGLPNVGGSLFFPVGDLGRRVQYEIELPLTYHLAESVTDAFDIKLTPYYRSQDLGQGSFVPIGGGFAFREPASTTAIYGATLGIVYRFQPIGPGATASATPAIPGKAKDSLRYR